MRNIPLYFFSGAGSGLIGSVVGGSVGHMLSDKAARKAAKKAAKHGGQHPGQYPQGQHGGGETTGLFLKSWNLSLFQSDQLLRNFLGRESWKLAQGVIQ